MKFIKENIHDILRLLLNQIALGVFGWVIFAATCKANDDKIGLLAFFASIFSIIFYMYILYATMQEIGSKHRIRVDGGRMKRNTAWGLIVMAISLIPTAAVLLIRFVAILLQLIPNEITVTSSKFVFVLTEYFLNFALSCYNGVIGFITGSSASIPNMLFVTLGYTLSLLPGLLVCWGSYVMGLHDKKLFSFLVKSNKNNPDNHDADNS